MNVIWQSDEQFDIIKITDAQFFIGELPHIETAGVRGNLTVMREKKKVCLGPFGETAYTSRGRLPPEPEVVYGMFSLTGELFGFETHLQLGDTFRLVDIGVGQLTVDASVILKEVCFNIDRSIEFVSVGKPEKLYVAGVNLLEATK